RRTHVLRIPRPLLHPFFDEIAPRSTSKFRVVTGAIDLPAEVPTERTTYYDIRGEMLLTRNACQGDGRCKSVRKELRQWPRILVRQHAGDGPRNRGMLRWEGGATLEERSVAIVLVGARALRDGLQTVRNDGAIQGSLAT